MLMPMTLAGFFSLKSNNSMTRRILVVLLLMPLAGCAEDGGGGPVISSLSTSTQAEAGMDSPSAPSPQEADSEGVSFDGETDPVITMTPTQNRVIAHLAWEQPPDINVEGYYVYFGKHASQEQNSDEPSSEESTAEVSDSCSRGESQATDAPTATITGLEPNTSYFFAIRAFSKSESFCSNEIVAMTPPVQS